MLSEDEEYLPISALQHLVFCERQTALIHVLGRWRENEHTAMGRVVHERVDGGDPTARHGVQVLRSVPLRSERLKLRGVADLVEVHRLPDRVQFIPVEYKKGKRRKPGADDIQLAAQAMALEEMTGTSILEAALFMAKIKRRRRVTIDELLRQRVEAAAARLHDLFRRREIPQAHFDERCRDCSLQDECGPKIDLPAGSLLSSLREALS